MSNRKATFAKRQRETELKDHARQKDERRNQRKIGSEARVGKGPEIAWDQAIDTTKLPIEDVVQAGPKEGDDDYVAPLPDGPTNPSSGASSNGSAAGGSTAPTPPSGSGGSVGAAPRTK